MSIKVINIGGRAVNNYVLITEFGCVVIDTGYAGGFPAFSRRLSESGVSMTDISYIFLTHAHDDHAGFLGELILATEAPVILHHEAINRLMLGHNQFIGGCSSKLAQLFCRCMSIIGNGKQEFPPVNVSSRAIVVDAKTQPLENLSIPATVLLLPGHTADSIGLLLDDGRLFCGDAAMNNFPSVARHTIWIEDAEMFIHSWDLIIASGAKIIYPGHGKPFPVEDLRRFYNYMEGKNLLPI
ncbi:MBL fold metallo-hydrolase [Clostridium sp.]|uniref:MBL fold metallo-hydrolase n=1 Tax=Clostridium sp. TaxID=1506 RepID=UPI003D6C99A9